MLPVDKVYILNVKDRKDRLIEAKDEMMAIGQEEYQFVYALEGASRFNSFNRSQHKILQMFVDSGYETCAVLEDDVWFQDMNTLIQAMKELPEDWLMLYLGANVSEGVFGIKENEPEAYSKHLVRLKHGWTSQAIIYKRAMAEMIVNSFNPDDNHMFDDWISREIMPTNPVYLTRPMVALQKTGFSDLWQNHADYSDAWIQSNRKIMAL